MKKDTNIESDGRKSIVDELNKKFPDHEFKIFRSIGPNDFCPYLRVLVDETPIRTSRKIELENATEFDDSQLDAIIMKTLLEDVANHIEELNA